MNAVPQEGVPKYDFLRSMLQGALNSPDAAPDSGLARGILKAPQRAAGKAVCCVLTLIVHYWWGHAGRSKVTFKMGCLGCFSTYVLSVKKTLRFLISVQPNLQMSRLWLTQEQ